MAGKKRQTPAKTARDSSRSYIVEILDTTGWDPDFRDEFDQQDYGLDYPNWWVYSQWGLFQRDDND